ncbi:MFS transporter [Rathayibacter soli]|uniref:MFS transporter n=1 Tax=Rathayibacter soli TaxID=3144168 RepID=UPI0027E5418E|nr:MFS transporter [Glaciibacter superstes]
MTLLETPRGTIARPFPWGGLIVLACVVFLSVTAETLPTGLLPDMSSTLGVSEPQVGLLVTIFAVSVVATSAPLTALTRRWPRRGLLVGVILVLGISNLLAALAPDFGWVVATRVLGGMAHGMFWAIVGAYAGHLVPKEQIGRAVSIIIGGGTLAFVFGVPVATAAGHAFGWRMSFAGLGMLTVLGAALVWLFLPVVARSGAADAHAAASARAPKAKRPRDASIPAVLTVCGLATVIMIGHYAFYTYIAPFMISVMGVDAGAVGPLLFLYGAAGAIGLIIAGSVFGPRPQLGLVTMIALAGVSVSLLAVFAATPVLGLAAFLLWGLAFGALPPLLQTRLLHASSASFRDTASALYTTAFNIGIGGGALVGAVVYGAFGLGELPWIYVALLAIALVLIVVIPLVAPLLRRAQPERLRR